MAEQMMERVRDAIIRAELGFGPHVLIAFHQFTKGEQERYNREARAALKD